MICLKCRRGGSPDPPADFPPQRLELEQSGAPVWSSAAARLNFGPTAAAAWMRGQSLSLPRLTVFGSPLELGLVFSGGRGENELEPEGTCSRRRCESPPAAFWLLFRRGKRNSPKRVKPCKAARRVAAPYGRHGPRKTGARCAPLRRTWTALITRAFSRIRPCIKKRAPGRPFSRGRLIALIDDTNCWSDTGVRR